ncbi:hypothetical protein FOXB_14245 [Fusarium oxysporum f. sp. conglutinans Fo5176]|uniref:25S rRNA (Uridine(2843)-N(3))-methyltransferase n=1 Tax=Fusarium oxysporum (strain Fo5176) TaxID=660025 RepID=F9G6G3_FUSOF|nr:hypothetical protein FOXB_14245 [Fusarium oxysporum f. sp. conglutinans Fo5176]
MTKFKRNAQSQPKHGKPTASGASKAPVAPPVRRPGWTGPSYIHKPAKKTPAAVKNTSSTEQIQSLSVKHSQLILDTIRTTFPAVDEFNALIPVLREVREALEQKDYSKAFGTQEFLEAYTIRWSPSRALTSANVLAWICSEMSEAAWVQKFLHNEGQQKPSKIVCFGRGGSDLLAQGARFKYPAIPSHVLNLSVNHLNVLESDSTTLRAMIGPNPALITLFFTLHEFYSISISKTTAFLSRLTETAPKGSLLLVVDGPGADVVLPDSSNKGQEKKYPLEWLLYQALLPPKSSSTNSEDEEQPAWAKLIQGGHEKEYKLPTGLRFPGSLENTRFQVHLLERS